MEDIHNQKVAAITKRVRSFYKHKKSFKIYHGTTNSTRPMTFEKKSMIDVSELGDIISIDPNRQTALVEPNVPMDRLVRAALRFGLIPPVVMEFPGITVGGGLQGGAGESSSYKWGTFNRTLNWYDMILADGEQIRVSRTEHADLFWGAAGSYGSLGIVTLAEIKLIPARRFVELTYIPVTNFTEAVEVLHREMTRAEPDFIDSIMFSHSEGVIIVGNLTDNSEAVEQTFTKAHDEWFYLHARRQGQTGSAKIEKVPLYDYLFRYDRGAFWMGEFAFRRFKTPFNRFMRWLFDPLMHTRKMYEALQASGVSQECIIQDLALPTEHAAEFMDYIDTTCGIYPLWLCPLLPDDSSPLLSNHLSTTGIINIGVWGGVSGDYQAVVDANKALEAKTNELGGKKWLYAHVYYDELSFWKIYGGKAWYDALRKKYKAQSLPTLFDKVGNTKRHRVRAKRGVIIALLGLSGIRLE